MNNMGNRVIVFDTILRDGEQAPGGAMTRKQKIEIALALEALKVDVIEAGFPVSSDYEYKSIIEISKLIKDSTLCGLSRCIDSDIVASAKALKYAHAPRIHVFIATAKLLLEQQLHMSPQVALDYIYRSVSLARRYTDDVQWGAMDATRAEMDFLLKAIEVAINAGAKTIDIADTVGCILPDEMSALILKIKNQVPNIDKAILSLHCHDDLGLATANTLAGLQVGAQQFDATINGIGERAGNAALEEVVMAIKTRHDVYPFDMRVQPKNFTTISELVAKVTGFAVFQNKSIVGQNVFRHGSGIHQDGILKNQYTYQIFDPKELGYDENLIDLSRHSGNAGLKYKLKQLQIVLNDLEYDNLYKEFKKLSVRKKIISHENLLYLVEKIKKDRH